MMMANRVVGNEEGLGIEDGDEDKEGDGEGDVGGV